MVFDSITLRCNSDPRTISSTLVENAMISRMAKALTEPLFVLLVLQVGVLFVCWRRFPRRQANAAELHSLIAASIGAGLLILLSIPAVGVLLKASLSVSSAADLPPDFIVVLAGGTVAGRTADLDVLSDETSRRVAFGVRYWKMHPLSRLVMAGAAPGSRPRAESELMAQRARCAGVPATAIILEPAARNTREHPIRLRALQGFAPDSRLAIVTSAWHERRAVAEFRRYFRNVQPAPVPEPSLYAPDWLPGVDGLRASTEAIHEYIGIAWYALLS